MVSWEPSSARRERKQVFVVLGHHHTKIPMHFRHFQLPQEAKKEEEQQQILEDVRVKSDDN